MPWTIADLQARMSASIEDLWSMSEKALVTAYADTRRRYAEKKRERDT